MGNQTLASLAVFAFIALNTTVADTPVKPQNHSEIKSLIETYALTDDMMDDRLIAARESMRSKGEEAIPSLIELFKENPNDQYRAAIIDALQFNRGNKQSAIILLTDQLSASPDQWQGQLWIASAICFIANENPQLGREVARKGLNVQSDFVKHSAIRSLGEVGAKQDVEKLQSLKTQRKAKLRSESDGLLVTIELAIKRIEERSQSPKQ